MTDKTKQNLTIQKKIYLSAGHFLLFAACDYHLGHVTLKSEASVFRIGIKNYLISMNLHNNIGTLQEFSIFSCFSNGSVLHPKCCFGWWAWKKKIKLLGFIHLCTKKIRKQRGTINIWN